MKELQIFKSQEFGQVRVVEVGGKPYFVGRDIAQILEYKEPHKAISTHCKRGITYPILTNGGKQETKIIPEGDIYRLIVKAADQSKSPTIKAKAEKFETWIFDEVLPTIRKHGGYLTPDKVEEALLNPDTIIQLATRLKEEQQLNKKQQQIIGELKPKADYTDRILKNKGLVTVTQIAKDYGMSAQRMNDLLHELKIQYKQSGQWLLYRKYHGRGYTHSETIDIVRSDGSPDIKMNTKWTQKGRLFLYDLLKENGVLPVIERDLLQTK